MTLLECACAIALLGTAFVSGLALFTAQDQAFALQQEMAQASSLLQRELERVLGTPFEDLRDQLLFLPIADAPSYSLQTRVQPINSELMTVRLNIRWTSAFGTVRTESATTYCFDREGN